MTREKPWLASTNTMDPQESAQIIIKRIRISKSPFSLSNEYETKLFPFSTLRNALVFNFPMLKPALRCAELCMMDMSPTGAGSCQHQSPKENNSLPIFRQRQNNSTFSAGLRMEGPVRVLSVIEGTNPQEQERQSVLHLSYLKDTGRAASVTILIAGLALVET